MATLQDVRETAADQLGLLLNLGLVGSVGGNTLTVTKAAEVTSDQYKLVNAYLRQNAGTYPWSRITAVSSANLNQLTVNSGTGFTVNSPVRAYLLLTPDEWDAEIKAGGAEEMVVREQTITPVAGQTDYTIPNIQTGAQILGVEAVDQTSGRRWDIATLRWRQDGGTIRMHLTTPYQVTGNYVFVVKYRVPEDTSGWNEMAVVDLAIPFRLLVKIAQVRGLRRIFRKYGQAYKAQFAPALAIAEQELTAMRSKWTPPIRSREWEVDWESPSSIRGAVTDVFWGW